MLLRLEDELREFFHFSFYSSTCLFFLANACKEGAACCSYRLFCAGNDVAVSISLLHRDGVTAGPAAPGCSAQTAATQLPGSGLSQQQRPSSKAKLKARFLPVAPILLELPCNKLLDGDVCTAADRLNCYSFPCLLFPFKNYLPDS